MPERLYTAYQVAGLLGATPAAVVEWMEQGLLESRRLGESLRVPATSLVRFLKDHGVAIEELMEEAVREDGQFVSELEALEKIARRRRMPALEGELASVKAQDAEAQDHTKSGAAEAEAPAEAFGLSPIELDEETPPGTAEDLADEQTEIDEAIRDLPEPPEPDDGFASEAQPSQAAKPGQPAEEPQPAEAEATSEPAGTHEPLPPAAEQLAEAILADAVANDASFIHLEPEPDGLTLRLRVGGGLIHKPAFKRGLPEPLHEALLQWFLRAAGAEDAARGRFARTIDGREIDFALSRYRSVCGTKVVLAVNSRRPTETLGTLLDAPRRAALKQMLRGGLVLVCGDPGSCPRTLEALAGRCAAEERCVVRVGGPAQSACGPAGFVRAGCGTSCTRAEAIVTIAEADADVILLDQLRDPETAEVAVEAALAGKLVVAAAGTPLPQDALKRLADFELEPWPLSDALSGLLRVHWARRLCRCAATRQPRNGELSELSLELSVETVREPQGCEECDGTGYRGAAAVASVIPLTAGLTNALRFGFTPGALERMVREASCPPIGVAAAEALRSGCVSIGELRRVL